MYSRVLKICLVIITLLIWGWGGMFLVDKSQQTRVSIVVQLSEGANIDDSKEQLGSEESFNYRQVKAHQLAHLLRSDAIAPSYLSNHDTRYFDARVIAGTSYIEMISEASNENEAIQVFDEVMTKHKELINKIYRANKNRLKKELNGLYQSKLQQLEEGQSSLSDGEEWRSQGVEFKYSSLLKSQVELKLRVAQQRRLLSYVKNYHNNIDLGNLYGISAPLDQILTDFRNATIKVELAKLQYGHRHSVYLLAKKQEVILIEKVTEILPSISLRLQQDLDVLQKRLDDQIVETKALEKQTILDQKSILEQSVFIARQEAASRNLIEIENRLKQLELELEGEQMEVISPARLDEVGPQREKQAMLIAYLAGLFCLLWCILRCK